MWRRKYYMAVLAAYGDCPNPRASVKELRDAVKFRIMTLLPQYVDPEVPDDWFSLMGVIFHVRGVEPPDRVRILKLLQKAAGETKSGSLLEAYSQGETESLSDNIMDTISDVFSGDWESVISDVGDIFDDLFSGGSWLF